MTDVTKPRAKKDVVIVPTTEIVVQNTTIETPPITIDVTAGGSELIAPSAPALVVMTAAQESAHDMLFALNDALLIHLGQRPSAIVAFKEPSKDELKTQRREYMLSHELDITDEDNIVEAALAIKAIVDAQRAEFIRQMANESSVKLEWLRCARDEIRVFAGAVDIQISAITGIAPSAPKTVRTQSGERSVASSAVECNKAYIAWAQAHGLEHFDMVMLSKAGYKNGQRADVRALEDGMWQRLDVTYHADGSVSVVPTETIVKSYNKILTKDDGTTPSFKPESMWGLFDPQHKTGYGQIENKTHLVSIKETMDSAKRAAGVAIKGE